MRREQSIVLNHRPDRQPPLGDRLESIANPKAIEAALAITSLAPMVPMLSWARNGVAKHRSRCSAISVAALPMRAARAAARNSPVPREIWRRDSGSAG